MTNTPARRCTNPTGQATAVESSFVGTLSADGTTLTGTLHLGVQQAPVTFTKAGK